MRQQPHMLKRRSRGAPSLPTGWSPEVERAIEPIAGEWDELADRVAAPPFLRPGWFAAWWTAFGRGTLEILVLRRYGVLAAVLPLARRLGCLRSLSNWHTPAYAAVTEPGAEPLLAVMLLACVAREVTLAFVDPTSRFVKECIGATNSSGGRALTRVVERSPYLPLDGAWDEFERDRFSSKRRAIRRQRLRQLSEAGAVSFEVSAGGDGLEARLAEGLAVEARGWKGKAGTAILSRPESRRFYGDVARWAAARGELRLGFLRTEGRPIAFDLALEAGDAHYLLKTGYDPDYRRFAPGIELRADMVARAFARGVGAYEFLGQDAEWKREWTDLRHDRATVQLYPTGPAARLQWATQKRVAPVARRALAKVRE
jgi:CelD/BcsL family acetyltransferase involved in cellulose biosynthesis